MDLRSALLGCSSGQLARIAAAWTMRIEPGTLRRELVELVAVRIVAETDGTTLWSSVGPLERETLAALVRAGGRHESDLLARRLVRALPAPSDPDDALRAIDGVVVEMVERGLLFRVYDAEEQRRGVYLVMPDEVLAAARQHLDLTRDWKRPAAHHQPDRVAEPTLAADLFVLASALRREAWSGASRGLARRPPLSVGQILARLGQQSTVGPGEPGRRWRFLLWVAQRAGWISRDPWPMPDDETLERLLTEPRSLPAQALAAGAVGQGARGARASEPSSPRARQAAALQLLSELDGDRWWQADDVVEWLTSELADADADSSPSGRRRPDGRDGQQIQRWLGGRWFWLGLVAWGSGDQNGWSTISPTPSLRALTTGRSVPVVPTARACLLDDGLRLLAPVGADLALLYRAERYLAFAGTQESVRTYTLTPPSFERGLRLGGDADDLLAVLERLAQQPPLQAWLDAIGRWSRSSDRLRLEARLLLTVDRAETLAEALRTASNADALAESISPRHAVVAVERVPGLLADLAQAGLPVEVEPGVRAEPSSAGRAAGLSGGVAESAWVALDVLRRIAPDVVAEQRDLQLARGRLEAVLSAGVLEGLGRRAATIAAAIADRRRARGGRRVV